ncbi:MAG: hypothetical protein Q8O67_18800 [Deltaproteobacteria bacterium]|nr:hypothetical protein [Deltaproteobacteria bacterium]
MSVLAAFCAWRRERLPLLPFFGVAVVVAAAAGDVRVVVVAVAFVWIAVLRLWDDLVSREQDAGAHPERVLVRSPPAPFRRALLIGVALAVVVAVAVGAFLGFVALLLALALVYVAPLPAIARRFLVLAKYPAIAWLLASSSSSPRLEPLFLCLVCDEFFTGERPLLVRALPFAFTFFWLLLT